MPEQICPRCYTDNPGKNRYCGNCGAALNGYAIVPSRAQLPVPAQNRWQDLAEAPLFQAATISLGALILRSAFSWLHRRSVQRRSLTVLPISRSSPSRTFFEAGRNLLPSQPERSRIITLAWWNLRIEGTISDFENDLEQFRW
jgi:hypothetical protein